MEIVHFQKFLLTLVCALASGAVDNMFSYSSRRRSSGWSGPTVRSGMLNAWRAPVVSLRKAGAPIPTTPENGL